MNNLNEKVLLDALYNVLQKKDDQFISLHGSSGFEG